MPVGVFAGFDWPQRSALADPDLACLTAELFFQRPIQRCCPACWREDAIPHFRHRWRLAHHHACPAHRPLLRDRCPRCRARVGPEARSALNPGPGGPDRAFRACPRCRMDPAEGGPAELPADLAEWVLDRQDRVDAWVAGSVPPEAVPPPTGRGLPFRRSPDGVVGLEGDGNRRPLRGAVAAFCAALEWEDLGRAAAERCRAALRGLLRAVGDGEGGALLAGLDGHRLFGDAAADLGLHCLASGTLAGGTFWSPGEAPLADERADGFTAAEVRRARRWIDGHFKPTHPTRPSAAAG